ncbi:Gfo/Idh/MocA family oxidoreductase [Candidatus Electronema sp. PJ]|uniref:Gfo/Idh/MocA family oxidoreductase n=1 Tax=Candidatus Electronema sp. PJ TaxID=3401572 RepID=UPI003AA7BBB1
MHTQNIAVVGTGYWGKNLVRNFSHLGALRMICDISQEAVEKFIAQYPGTVGVHSYHEVLADKAVQGVVLATPAASHAAMCQQALLAGKDVYVEKPLCLSEEEGAELIALAEQQGRILMVGHLLWYHPVVLKLKELIDAGALGRIQYIYSNRLNLGKLRREENVLWSFAPHDISVILGLLGEMPESIQAQGGNYLHRKIADTTVSLLNFASGVRAHIFVSWLHPFKEQKLVVVGDKKMAVFDDTALWPDKLLLYPHSVEWAGNIPVAHKAEAEKVTLPESEPLRAECQAFLDAIASRKPPYTDGKEGLNVLKVLNRCQHALESGATVVVEQSVEEKKYRAHASAVIDHNTVIGQGTQIWHFSHILSGTEIGAECSIGQNAVLGPNVRVGRGCKIQNNVSVYEGVTLEEYIFCGPSMVFTNVYNPRCEFPRKAEYRQTLVKRGATIGANCTVVCGITIGSYAFIAAGAVVKADVPDFALMVGCPARQIGWMSRFGERLDLPLHGNGEAVCPHTGERYQLTDNQVHIVYG